MDEDEVLQLDPDRKELVEKFLMNTKQNKRPFHGLGRLSSIMTQNSTD